ncbi:MAG: hypothetical protein AB7O21_12595 [Gammaproteobacteria bacterium]
MVRAQVQAWQTRFDALALKERVLVIVACALFVLGAWDRWLLQPLDDERHRLATEIDGISRALTETERLTADVLAKAAHDPDATVREELIQKRAALALAEAEIRQRIGRMVAPEQMAQVLESVLSGFDRLEFVGLEGLGAEPVSAPPGTTNRIDTFTAQDEPAAESVTAYRHGIRIRFAGGFLDVLDYLRALEALPWGFFWDSVELVTDDYPRATGSIVVYTLSVHRGWIGL